MKDARQEFEALARTMPYDVTRNATGRYKWYETQCAWEAWKHQAARIAELEAQVAHMADLVEPANNATERADKLEAQVKALQRKPLSEEVITRWVDSGEYNVITNDWASHIDFARAIEAAHNIK